MYRALYRKYRPQTFEDVVGQEHIVKTLQNQIINNKISHAYMFTGTRGTGKTTCAKIFARAVNCVSPENGDPCNECEICRGISNGSIMDVFEIDAASNNGVDDIRELREDVIFTPAQAKYKVYIIDEVHMLSTAAFNALLKTLEDPPEHIIFIFATTEINKVPQTILSRCQRFDFKRITVEDIANRLKKVAVSEKIELDDDAALLIARMADGALRDALSILDRCIDGNAAVTLTVVEKTVGVCPFDELAKVISAFAGHDTAALLEFYARCRQTSRDAASLFSEICSVLRDMMVVRLSCGTSNLLSYGGDRLETVTKLSEMLTLEEMTRAVTLLQNGIYDISRYKDKHIMAELTLIKLANPQIGESTEDLQARISRLEVLGVPSAPRKEAKASSKKPEKPKPETAKPAAPTAQDGELNEKLIKALSLTGGNAFVPFLEDIVIRFENGILNIECAKDELAYSIISTPESVSLIEQAARSITGEDYVVRFSDAGGKKETTDKDIFGELVDSADDII